MTHGNESSFLSGRVELGWIGMALDENQQMEGRFAAWMRGTENKTCDVMRQGCIGWGPNLSMLLEASDGRRHMKSFTERESIICWLSRENSHPHWATAQVDSLLLSLKIGIYHPFKCRYRYLRYRYVSSGTADPIYRTHPVDPPDPTFDTYMTRPRVYLALEWLYNPTRIMT